MENMASKARQQKYWKTTFWKTEQNHFRKSVGKLFKTAKGTQLASQGQTSTEQHLLAQPMLPTQVGKPGPKHGQQKKHQLVLYPAIPQHIKMTETSSHAVLCNFCSSCGVGRKTSKISLSPGNSNILWNFFVIKEKKIGVGGGENLGCFKGPVDHHIPCLRVIIWMGQPPCRQYVYSAKPIPNELWKIW